jgi:hypothetical protein
VPFTLPRYAIVGARPVKAVQTEDGGMTILALDWKTGEFVRDLDYTPRVLLPDEEVDVVSADEFEAYVDRIRQRIARGEKPLG